MRRGRGAPIGMTDGVPETGEEEEEEVLAALFTPLEGYVRERSGLQKKRKSGKIWSLGPRSAANAC